MVKPNKIIVRADWDDEAKVWVASSSDIEGLAAESATLEDLMDAVTAAVIDLIEANGSYDDATDIPIHLMAEQIAHIPVRRQRD